MLTLHDDGDGSEAKAKKKREIISWIKTLCIPSAIVIFLNLFIIKLAYVKGDSMYPTLHDRNILLVRQILYTPERDDIVLINTDYTSMAERHIVKRVIAVEGQTVTINYDDNSVAVDGVILDEPYLNFEYSDPLEDIYGTGTRSYTVPSDSVFVLGDNRNVSLDSRSEVIGMVRSEDIVGKMVIVFGV